MKQFLSLFVDSAKEFKNLRSLVTAALLVALHTVMALFLSIQVTPSLRISISFICNAMIGAFFGPVMGFVCGGLGDVVQYVIKPMGAFNPGLTLSAAFAGLIYGCFFYKRIPQTEAIIKKKDANAQEKKAKPAVEIILDLVAIIAAVLSAFSCIRFPFLSKTTESGQVLFHGDSVAIAVVEGFKQGTDVTIPILGILAAVSAIVLFAMNFMERKVIPFLYATFMLCLCVLAVYTDRKSISIHYGFVIIMVCFFVYLCVAFVQMTQQNGMNLKFLLRCVICMLVDVVLVNILHSTFWISKLYGMDFMVLLVPRTMKNLIQLPINVLLSYYILLWSNKAIRKK